jgi:hypothetical protein
VDRGDLKILAFRNLLLGAGIVPDADFVDDTFEIALGSPRRAHGSSDAGMLDAVKSRRCVCGGFGFEIAVKVNAPRSSIVRSGGVIPYLVGNSRGACDRMISASRHVLKIGREMIRSVNPEKIIHIQVAAISLLSTLGDQGYSSDSAGARERADPSSVAFEPALDGKLRKRQDGGGSESDVVVPAVEVDRALCERSSGDKKCEA